jgi:hypothetical protein
MPEPATRPTPEAAQSERLGKALESMADFYEAIGADDSPEAEMVDILRKRAGGPDQAVSQGCCGQEHGSDPSDP